MPSLHEKRQSATPAQQKSREAAADFVQTVYYKIRDDIADHVKKGNSVKTFERSYQLKNFVGFFTRTPDISTYSLEKKLEKLFIKNNVPFTTATDRSYCACGKHFSVKYNPVKKLSVPTPTSPPTYSSYIPPAYSLPMYTNFVSTAHFPSMTLHHGIPQSEAGIQPWQLQQFGLPTITTIDTIPEGLFKVRGSHLPP